MNALLPFLAILAGFGFLAMWLALIAPRRLALRAPQGPASPQQVIVAAENVPFVQGFVYSLVRGLVGYFLPTTEEGQLTSTNANYLLKLKQANWYWAPGELNPPTPSAPFWNLETLWSTKIVYGLMGCGVGFLMALPSVLVGLPFFVAFGGSLFGGAIGWLLPDGQMEGAISSRQHKLTIEMAYRVPELATYIRAGNSIVRAFRRLADRPGGPFVAEIRRALAVYDATTSLSTALEQMIERNKLRAMTEFGQQILMVEQEGGSVGPALDVLSQAAQRALRRRLEEQASDNARQMGLPVAGGMTFVVFMLIGSPALNTVLSQLL